MFGDFGHVLDMRERATAINDEDSAGQAPVEWATGDQHAIALSEAGAAMAAEGRHVVDSLGSTPTVLAERKIHADNQHLGVLETSDRVAEFLRFLVADRSVQGRYRGDDTSLAGAVGKSDVTQI